MGQSLPELLFLFSVMPVFLVKKELDSCVKFPRSQFLFVKVQYDNKTLKSPVHFLVVLLVDRQFPSICVQITEKSKI